MKSIVDTLATVSSPLEEEDIILYILNGLPSHFNSFKTTIRTRSETITVSELQELLLIKDQQLETSSAEESSA